MRTVLFSLLKQAFDIANQSYRQPKTSIHEFSEQEMVNAYTRREFLNQSLKAGTFLGVSAMLPQQIFASPPDARIVIVGAGLAGLTAAHYLKKAGFTKVTIYDANTNPGGRIQTLRNEIGRNLYTEAGGEFMDTNHKDIARLVKELDIEVIDTFKDPLLLKMETYFIEDKHRTMEEIVQEIQNVLPKISRDIGFLDAKRQNTDSKNMDNTPLEKYIDDLGASSWMSSLLKTAYTAEFGLDVGEQSTLNFLNQVNFSSKTDLHLYGDTKDRRYKIRGGNSAIITQLAKEFESFLYTNMRLTKIDNTNAGTINLTFNEREVIQANYVIIALPFSVLREVKMNKDTVSPLKKQCIQELGYGNHSKLMMGFTYRMWRSRGYMGYMLSDKTHQGWDNGLFQNQLQNKSTEGGYTICLGGTLAERLQNNDEAAATAHFLPQLDAAFPKMAESYIGKAKIMNWAENPFSKGSVACFKVGQMTTFTGVAQASEGNLLFAGEHCSTHFMGTMNGAVETGRQAAQQIINRFKTKS